MKILFISLLVIFLASIVSALKFLNNSYINASGSKAGFHTKRSFIIKITNDHFEISFTDNVLIMDLEVRYTILNNIMDNKE
ncbi:hypothetical protein H8356DRAFT_1425551 [Neocallimastix lanati (nom. inval.)]|nr:hypothetical protein H8356DRAFT_1425551 [Neocallimastix sp. JGI-2020a]